MHSMVNFVAISDAYACHNLFSNDSVQDASPGCLLQFQGMLPVDNVRRHQIAMTICEIDACLWQHL